MPAPKLAVLGSGALLLIGGLTIITGFQPTFGIVALVLFYLPVTFMMFPFWKEQDPMAKMGDMINFMKNIALLGVCSDALGDPATLAIQSGRLKQVDYSGHPVRKQ